MFFHLFGKSCSLGWPYVLFSFSLFVILVISRFGFEYGIWVLVAPVPGVIFVIADMVRVTQPMVHHAHYVK